MSLADVELSREQSYGRYVTGASEVQPVSDVKDAMVGGGDPVAMSATKQKKGEC